MFVQCTLSFTFVRVYRQIQKVEYHSCNSSSSSSSIPNHTSKTTLSAIQSSVAAAPRRRRTSQNPMLTNFSTCVRQRRSESHTFIHPDRRIYIYIYTVINNNLFVSTITQPSHPPPQHCQVCGGGILNKLHHAFTLYLYICTFASFAMTQFIIKKNL